MHIYVCVCARVKIVKKQKLKCVFLYVGFIFRSLENFSNNYSMKNNFDLLACMKTYKTTCQYKMR